jgi:WD40 repeat protein
VAFHPDGRRLLSAHMDKTLRWWDTTTGQETHCIQAHDWSILSMALSPNGEHLATASDDAVRVWDVATGRVLVTLQPPFVCRPTSLAFHPDGQLLASAGADGTIVLWDTRTWQRKDIRLRDPTGGVESLAFSPDGRLLAWGSTDATVKVWQAATGDVRHLYGHTSWVKCVTFSPNGERIASGSLDGTVRIWEVNWLSAFAGPKAAALGK